jgi:hypothetical protein
MPSSPEDTLAAMIAALPEKTGKSLEDWIGIVRREKPGKHGEIVQRLKEKHGVTHGYANLIAHRALGSDAGSVAESGQDLVAGQYGGAKAALRPVYDVLVAKVIALGPDVELAPKKAYVSLRRFKQFGLIQPSTATRLDLGLNLRGVAPAGRLEASGSFSAMCTHRVRLERISDVDAELLGWIGQAYDNA